MKKKLHLVVIQCIGWLLGLATVLNLVVLGPQVSAFLFVVAFLMVWLVAMLPDHEKYTQRYLLYLHRLEDYKRMREVYPFSWREFRREVCKNMNYDV